MNTTKHQGFTAAMLERARRVLELTHQDWQLHEQPKRKAKASKKQPHSVGTTAYKSDILRDSEPILMLRERLH